MARLDTALPTVFNGQTVSAASIPLLVIAGWVSDELGVALLGLANAVFIGGLAFANTDAQ